uniref:Small rubber particle protein 2 n=1 Tax=Taraxacum kok-saghyz TaxID=333970 RepID=A0A0Y0BP09_TARKO|nr:small rubber particle protein 2 [Taraxacum kok-saghyz]
MAENDAPVTNQPEVQIEQEKLKYLEFVQVAAIHAILYATRAYGYAKDNSGPLKPSVETIEGTLKTVVSPAYQKFHGVPVEVLKLVDRKVDESVTIIDSRVPPLLKEVKTAGVVETASGLAKTAYTKIEPAAKGLYVKYEPVAEQYAASAWHSLNQLPLFPKVANVVVPKAAYYSEKYNQTVQQSAELTKSSMASLLKFSSLLTVRSVSLFSFHLLFIKASLLVSNS